MQEHSAAVTRRQTRRTAARTTPIDPERMSRKAREAANFLRAIANEHRLLILCHLHRGEMSVGALADQLGLRQAHLSQQLSVLRADGLVQARRESRMVHYSLASPAAAAVIERLYELFCQERPTDGPG